MSKKVPHLKVIEGAGHAVTCPMCDKPARAPHKPFCSRRCAQLDLGKWLTGDYTIPAYEPMEDSDIEAFLAEQSEQEGEER